MEKDSQYLGPKKKPKQQPVQQQPGQQPQLNAPGWAESLWAGFTAQPGWTASDWLKYRQNLGEAWTWKGRSKAPAMYKKRPPTGRRKRAESNWFYRSQGE